MACLVNTLQEVQVVSMVNTFPGGSGGLYGQHLPRRFRWPVWSTLVVTTSPFTISWSNQARGECSQTVCSYIPCHVNMLCCHEMQNDKENQILNCSVFRAVTWCFVTHGYKAERLGIYKMQNLHEKFAKFEFQTNECINNVIITCLNLKDSHGHEKFW